MRIVLGLSVAVFFLTGCFNIHMYAPHGMDVTLISSDEPVEGKGDGNREPDWAVTGDLTLKLRAERAGKGDGRVYTIDVTCTDTWGNSSSESTTVTVPHNK